MAYHGKAKSREAMDTCFWIDTRIRTFYCRLKYLQCFSQLRSHLQNLPFQAKILPNERKSHESNIFFLVRNWWKLLIVTKYPISCQPLPINVDWSSMLIGSVVGLLCFLVLDLENHDSRDMPFSLIFSEFSPLVAKNDWCSGSAVFNILICNKNVSILVTMRDQSVSDDEKLMAFSFISSIILTSF